MVIEGGVMVIMYEEMVGSGARRFWEEESRDYDGGIGLRW